MKKIFNIEEFFTFAENKEDAVRQYVERMLKLTGDEITEFKEDNIFDAMHPFFEAVAERFNGTVSFKNVGNPETRIPIIIFDDFIFGKSLILELIKDDFSDGFTLKLVWHGEKPGQMMVQVLEYISDVDAMEHQIRDAVSTISIVETFS